MVLEVGGIYEGKITGITKFGAFVSFEGGKSGLVHISEVANSYVNDVNEHVKVGQTVKVKVLTISPEGKINLSIKRAEEQPRVQQPRNEARPRVQENSFSPARPVKHERVVQPMPQAAAPTGEQDFEDRLKKFMQESNSRIADNPMYSDRRQRSRRR